VITVARLRGSRSLDDDPVVPPVPAPLVSVVVPARDEAHNIPRCVTSLLTAQYPALEFIVVDDQSGDGTGNVARAIAACDARVTVVDCPPLPAGWFGKQWACQTGAGQAHGEILAFVDADTRAAPDLIPRAVNAMLAERADLLSVIGRQEMHTLAERLIQPQVFAILAARYGGTETVNRSRRATDRIANGQYLMIRRDTYDALHGHAAVRACVAEDLMLAQTYFAAGRIVVLRMGWTQLSTRMYTSLNTLVSGWRKNVFAAGREAIPFGRVGQLLFPLVLPMPALMQIAPVVTLLVALLWGVPPGMLLWAAIAYSATLAWWMVVYGATRNGVRYALLFPVGAALLAYIVVTAAWQGSRVTWNGRDYVTRRASRDPIV